MLEDLLEYRNREESELEMSHVVDGEVHAIVDDHSFSKGAKSTLS